LGGRARHLISVIAFRISVIAFRRAVLLNVIALPGCAATLPTACYGWNLTCWTTPADWKRRDLARWEKVHPGSAEDIGGAA
jgi:hypothetical protein